MARAWGGDRHINDGHAHSDGNKAVPVSLECTQTSRPWWQVVRVKSKQAIVNARTEGRPPVVVIGAPGMRLDDATVILPGGHGWLLDVCRKAGIVPVSVVID